MNITDLSTEIKQAVYTRQNGMCAFTGKKFEEFSDNIDADFVAVDSSDTSNNAENIIMVWKQHTLNPNVKLRKYLFTYANFVDYDSNSKLHDFKEDIEEINGRASVDTDIRGLYNTINDLTNNIKLLGVTPSQRGEVKDQLHAVLNIVRQRQSEIKENDRKEWGINYQNMKTKIDEAIEFAKNASIYKAGRDKLFEVQKELRQIKLDTEHKIELEKLLSSEIKVLSEKIRNWSENFQMECIENYYNLRNVADEAVHKAFSFETFAESRDILIDVQNKIKEKGRTLQKNQKDELFGYIRSTFDKLTEKFADYKPITDEEAATNYAEVKPKVEQALEFAKEANVSSAREVREKLIEAQGIIKEVRLKREQKDELFSAIREVFTKVDELSAEERKRFDADADTNYNTLLSKIEIVIVDIENLLDFRTSASELNAIFTELKLAKLKKEQRNKLFSKTKLAFEILSQKRQEYDKRKFAEKKSRLGSLLEEFQQKSTQIQQLLAKDKEILQQQQEKYNSFSDDNTLKEKSARIIDEINARIKEREAISERIRKKIDKIQKDIDNTAEQEKTAKERASKSKYAAKTADKPENDKNENSQTEEIAVNE